MNKLNFLDWLTLILVIVGALNWGLIGFFSFDLVAFIFGAMTLVSKIIYILVGLSALYLLFVLPKLSKK